MSAFLKTWVLTRAEYTTDTFHCIPPAFIQKLKILFLKALFTMVFFLRNNADLNG